MAGDEIGLLDEVGRADWLPAESQMRYGNRARFFRVVDEISLGEEIRLLRQ